CGAKLQAATTYSCTKKPPKIAPNSSPTAPNASSSSPASSPSFTPSSSTACSRSTKPTRGCGSTERQSEGETESKPVYHRRSFSPSLRLSVFPSRPTLSYERNPYQGARPVPLPPP